MGSIGPDYSTLSPHHYLLVLLVLFLIIEFRPVRNSFLALLFLLHIGIGIRLQHPLWISLIAAGKTGTNMPLIFFALNFVILLLITWLLWRRKSSLWRGVAMFGWILLAGAAGYSILQTYADLQGFFHWIQVAEFVLVALLLGAPPLLVIYTLKRLWSAPRSWSRGSL